ncbi:MAG: hypothetical protein NTV39_00400 [Candidatus Saccharibacteria bacterium]|nr:hypothetical protein [Candidatus Saccharibacteria bacterium]
MDEESDDQEQVLNVHVHHKEVTEDSESIEPTPDVPDSESIEPPKTFEPQPIGPELVATPKRKRKLKKWMIIVPVLLVLVVAAGAGAFYLANNKKPVPEKTKTPAVSKTASVKAVPSLKPTDVVTKVQDYIKTKYPQVMPEGTKLTGEQIYFKDSSAAPNWKIPGEKFYVSYSDNGAAKTDIYYNWESVADNIVSARYMAISGAAIKSLTDQGFVKNTDSVYGEGSGSVAYTKGDVVCVTSSPDNGTISPPSSLACGQISKYTKNLESYKEIEPYALAIAKSGEMDVGAVFSFSELKAGIKGYKNAKVGLSNAGTYVGGSMGLFYKSPTGDWQFFKGSQSLIMCKDFNTKDIQYAFAFESCYDDNKTGDAAMVNVAGFYNLQP